MFCYYFIRLKSREKVAKYEKLGKYFPYAPRNNIYLPANSYLFKVNTREIETRCEDVTSMTSSGVFIGNFENISHLFLMLLFLTLNK